MSHGWGYLILSIFLPLSHAYAAVTEIDPNPPSREDSESKMLIAAGGYVPFGIHTQKTDEGGSNVMSMHPLLSIGNRWQLYDNVFLTGLIGYVIHLGEKDKYNKTTSLLMLNLSSAIDSDLFLHYGIGAVSTKISGDGSALQINNGNGIATFWAPSRSSVSNNITFNLGLEIMAGVDYSFKTDIYIFGALSSLKRKISHSLGLVYYF
ncbi:MAG: hypothetical protein OXB84_03115 [Halobacteriovoraceae bacterium]|nr:hypothetical protein [Halobacteriovoraceae bacterium]